MFLQDVLVAVPVVVAKAPYSQRAGHGVLCAVACPLFGGWGVNARKYYASRVSFLIVLEHF